MIEYVVGPVLALLVGMKFTDFKSKEQANKIKDLEAKIEQVSITNQEFQKDVSQKVVTTFIPVVQQVKKLNEFVGIG